jgi:chromosomal replication initiation ATPase DnaA
MNKFIDYLSKKYNFNTGQELILFKETMPTKSNEEIFEYILSEVSINTGISEDEILGRSRDRKIMYVRHLLAYCLYRTNSFSLVSIGLKMGGRNHATIINSKCAAEDLISVKDSIMYPLYLKIKHLINEDNISGSFIKL